MSSSTRILITSGHSDDWINVPGFSEEDASQLNLIFSTETSPYGRGINGLKRYVREITPLKDFDYLFQWVEYNPKETQEAYLIQSYPKLKKKKI